MSVEVMLTAVSGEQLDELLKAGLGKLPVIQEDQPGFLLDEFTLAFMRNENPHHEVLYHLSMEGKIFHDTNIYESMPRYFTPEEVTELATQINVLSEVTIQQLFNIQREQLGGEFADPYFPHLMRRLEALKQFVTQRAEHGEAIINQLH
ncbi:MAG: hypothetical protein H6672_04025 [Anaerolineaceae bacterium]|nr:hypothetical protein [Anaerolineaceae bacterium]